MYTFLFDRRSLTLFLSGAGVLGLLLFSAGVLVGMRIKLPSAPTQADAFVPLAEYPQPLTSGSTDAPAATPPGSAEAPGDDSETSEKTEAARTRSVPTQYESRSSSAQSIVEAVAERAAPAAASPTPMQALRAEPARTLRRDGFTIQVGAFGVAENAEKTIYRLVAEGLDAYSAPIVTSSGRTLTAVRFGNYPDRSTALAGASQYLAAGEGRDALVRPPA